MKNNASNLVKFLLVAYTVTMIVLVIVSFLLFRFHVSESFVNGGVVFAYVISCFVGANLFCRTKSSRRFMWGGIVGLIYAVTIAIVSLILNRELFVTFPRLLPVFGLCVVGGILGGMMRSSKG
jgi:putative membrane protein (TIGR04086 family)